MNTRALPNLNLRRRVAAPDTREGFPTMVQIVPQSEDGRRPEVSAEPSERARLQEDRAGLAAWKLWGPYLSERQWGTVREDYSPHGNAWEYFSHDQARSRAYRWGEDGIAGICDEQQRLCLALALWNGRDPILKERLFGLTNGEGNHGEDVKELYYYLDATPTHSYLKLLYKYPQRAFPYASLVEENRRRGKDQPEFELIDTGVFDDDRYFDVFVEYAKAAPDDILMRVTVHNRGPEPATLHLLPQLWFRNTWSWREGTRRPGLDAADDGTIGVRSTGLRRLPPATATASRRCCSPRTRPTRRRLFGADGANGYFKDGFHDYVVDGNASAVNPERSRHQGGRPLSPRGSGRRHGARAPAPARREPQIRAVRRFRRDRRAAPRRGGRVLRRAAGRPRRRRTRARCSARRSPA